MGNAKVTDDVHIAVVWVYGGGGQGKKIEILFTHIMIVTTWGSLLSHYIT